MPEKLYNQHSSPTNLVSSDSKGFASATNTTFPPGTIALEQVSKLFRKATRIRKSYTTVKSSLVRSSWFRRLIGRSPLRRRQLVALDNVSFHIPPGTSLGVIGRNGSGKSTLLKLISGIYQPSQGKVAVSGRISALIELGAGFHPDFTGRENVYLGGVMYGLSREEIDRKFDAIVSFAELEEFIDDPVRTYSSGMYMRLGFSVAVFTNPDILLIDEVLAVGDASFVHRCYDVISGFKREGKTLLLVTHDLDAVVRWCDHVIWLEKGRIKKQGEPRWVVDQYLESVRADEERALARVNAELGRDVEGVQDLESQLTQTEATVSSLEAHGSAERWGSRQVEITGVRMLDSGGTSKWLFDEGEELIIEVGYQIHEPIKELVFGIGIIRADGVVIHGNNTALDQVEVPLPLLTQELEGQAKGTYRYRISRLEFLENSYFLDVAAHASDGTPFDYHHMQHKFSVRSASRVHGVVNPQHSWEFETAYQIGKSGLGKGGRSTSLHSAHFARLKKAEGL